MSNTLEIFHPILIQNFIRFETAAHYIRAQQQNNTEDTICRFKITPDHYKLIVDYTNTAPLLELTLNYDDTTSILTVKPNDTFLETYKNAIMSAVALKQSEDNKGRYNKFIKVID